MIIRKTKFDLNNIVVGLALLCLVPACSESNEPLAPGAKGSSTMPTEQVAQTHEIDVSLEAGKKKVRGEARATGVTTLEFSLSNIEVRCIMGDAEPGEISLSWIIKRQDRGDNKPGNPSDLEVRIEQHADRLVIEDFWHGKKKANRPSISIVITAHPDTLVSGKIGNGILTIENHRLGGISLGNGTVNATGTLVGNAAIEVGNGGIKGCLLILGGDHSVSLGNGVVDLKTAEGSSYKLVSSVAIGKITVVGVEFDRDWGFLGGSVNAIVGEGAGTLEVSAGNGHISLEVAK